MTIDDLVKTINGSGAGVTALFEGGKLSLTAKTQEVKKVDKVRLLFQVD